MNKVVLVLLLACWMAVSEGFIKIGKQFPHHHGGYHGGYQPGHYGGYGHYPGGGYGGPAAFGRPPYGGYGGANYPYYPSQQAAIHGGHGFGAYGTGYGR
ncbi:uncharacterized protein [Bemisia tabaci]|uniref:uncharacterized protein n=1 Tax=Bemisia tabaci TaxID=7038 RepID=UPI0008F99B7B|nr:PREDICTED: neuropeptide-like protein 29 [Bemisia tabaci]